MEREIVYICELESDLWPHVGFESHVLAEEKSVGHT